MESYEKKIIDISPQYLIEISKFVEILSAYYEQQLLGNLTVEFSSALTSIFSDLNQYLILYSEDAVMRQNSYLKTKINI